MISREPNLISNTRKAIYHERSRACVRTQSVNLAASGSLLLCQGDLGRFKRVLEVINYACFSGEFITQSINIDAFWNTSESRKVWAEVGAIRLSVRSEPGPEPEPGIVKVRSRSRSRSQNLKVQAWSGGGLKTPDSDQETYVKGSVSNI